MQTQKVLLFGNSGGKDSACVIAMAVKALGKDRVLAVSMPCNSINSDFEDAMLVADTFGVRFINVDLTNTYKELENELNSTLQEIDVSSIIRESSINIKPRLRMTTLYGIAQTLGYLVIGTGNLCEAMVRNILQNGVIAVMILTLLVILLFQKY